MTDIELNELLPRLANQLDELATAVQAVSGDKRSQTEMWGFAFPALDRLELASVASILADRIREHAPLEIDPDERQWLIDAASRVSVIKATIVPQLYGGNPNAASAYLVSLYALERILDRFLGWEGNPEIAKLPAKLARRVSAASTRVAHVERDTSDLEAKVQVILSAHEAADQLPIDLDILRAALENVKSLEEQAIKAQERISGVEAAISHAKSEAQRHADDAEKLVNQCDEAYRITTTTGLAAAFDQRGEKLRKSTNWWVGLLAVALGAGCWLGVHRVAALSSVLSRDTLNWGAIALHMVLSVVSVAAPLWFAWIATKQIQQRFKLAEDYAFKASVAKAYEGYRKEAARIDPEFEARLFASALTRLEEAPLRMIESDPSHGGPWHELIASEGFKRALETSTDLAERAYGIALSALPSKLTRSKAANATTSGSPESLHAESGRDVAQ